MRRSPEALLISAVLRTQSTIPVTSKGLDIEMFHAHADEWEWITDYVHRRRRTPSRTAFKSRFQDFRILAVDDIDHFIEEVKKAHTRHELIQALDVTASALQAGDDPYSVLAQLGETQRLLTVKQASHVSSESDIIEHWKPIYQDALRRFSRTQETGFPGIPTGFESLDVATGGVQPGHMWVIAARLGVGKTWTAVRMACTALINGHSPLYFSLEQSKAAIGFRAHTFLSQAYWTDTFKNLDLNKGENLALLEYRRFLANLRRQVKSGRFFVNDTTRGRITPQHLAAEIEDKNPDIVFIDYLTLMARESNEWQSVAKLIGDIKAVAEQYQVPMVVVSQANRLGGGKEPPGTEHLSQSDSVGQDSDAVVSISRYSDHVAKFRLSKFRHGIDGQLWFAEFDVNNGRYFEISGDEAEKIKQADMEVRD